MAKSLQVRCCIGQGIFWHARGPRRLGGSLDFLQRRCQPIAVGGQSFDMTRSLNRCLHAQGQKLKACATLHHHFSAQQIKRLDAMGAFVNHVQTVVAPILLHRKVPRVAVTSVHLDGQRIGFQTPLAGPALGDGREHLQQQRGVGSGLCATRARFVDQSRAVQLKRQCAFGITLLRQQHALHVGVFNDGHLGCSSVFTC